MKESDCRATFRSQSGATISSLPLMLLALTGCRVDSGDIGAKNDRVIQVTPGCEFLQATTETPECGGPPERCEQVQGETRVREFELFLNDEGIGPKELERRKACLEESAALTGAEVQTEHGHDRTVVAHGTWEQLQYLVHSAALLEFDVQCDPQGTLCQDCDGLDEEACEADVYCLPIRSYRADLMRECLLDYVFILCASVDTCDDQVYTAVDESGQGFLLGCDGLPGFEYLDEPLLSGDRCSELPPEIEDSDAGGP